MTANLTTEVTSEDFITDETRILHNVGATSLAILGFPANLATIITIVKTKLYKKVANVFILNLVTNNMIFCLVCLPYITVLSFTLDKSSKSAINESLCKAVGYASYSILGSELMGLSLISLNRFILVVYFDKYQRIYNNKIYVAVMLLISWIIPPILLFFPASTVWGDLEYDPARFFCHPFKSNDSFGKFLVGFVLVNTVPVLSVSYVGIIHKVWSSRRKINNMRTQSDKKSFSTSRSKNDTQLIMTVIAILTSFSILYLPFLLVSLVDSSRTKYSAIVHVTVSYLALAHCFINPVLYTVMNTHIKNAYIACCLCSKNKHSIGPQPTLHTLNTIL